MNKNLVFFSFLYDLICHTTFCTNRPRIDLGCSFYQYAVEYY